MDEMDRVFGKLRARTRESRGWPEWARDEVVTHVDVTLSWRDLVLIMLTRKFRVTTRTLTERLPGKVQSLPTEIIPRRPWRQHGSVSTLTGEPKWRETHD